MILLADYPKNKSITNLCTLKRVEVNLPETNLSKWTRRWNFLRVQVSISSGVDCLQFLQITRKKLPSIWKTICLGISLRNAIRYSWIAGDDTLSRKYSLHRKRSMPINFVFWFPNQIKIYLLYLYFFKIYFKLFILNYQTAHKTD